MKLAHTLHQIVIWPSVSARSLLYSRRARSSVDEAPTILGRLNPSWPLTTAPCVALNPCATAMNHYRLATWEVSY
jgi:hypothetical protein